MVDRSTRLADLGQRPFSETSTSCRARHRFSRFESERDQAHHSKRLFDSSEHILVSSASLNKAASKESPSAASPSTKKEPAAPVPKRAPIRSTTLDPRHLAAKRRSSTDIDGDAMPSGQPATGEDEDLIDELSSLTIPTADATASNVIPPQHGYSSPPAFMPAGHHSHRPSGSFPPPPFSQAKLSCIRRPIFLAVELVLLMATRTDIQVCIRLWLPLTCQDTSRIAQRRIPTHPLCLDVPSLPPPAPKAQHRKARRSVLHRSDHISTHPCAMARRSSIQESFQASVRRQWLEG